MSTDFARPLKYKEAQQREMLRLQTERDVKGANRVLVRRRLYGRPSLRMHDDPAIRRPRIMVL